MLNVVAAGVDEDEDDSIFIDLYSVDDDDDEVVIIKTVNNSRPSVSVPAPAAVSSSASYAVQHKKKRAKTTASTNNNNNNNASSSSSRSKPKSKPKSKSTSKSVYVSSATHIFFKSNKQGVHTSFSNFFPFLDKQADAALPADVAALASKPYLFKIDEEEWKSVEHYYQAMKFRHSGHERAAKEIQGCATALDAKKRNTVLKKKFPCNMAKFDSNAVMLKALRAKFSQNAALRSQLLETGTAQLSEVPGRSFSIWCYNKATGEVGLLGQLLMQVRAELQQEDEDEEEQESNE